MKHGEVGGMTIQRWERFICMCFILSGVCSIVGGTLSAIFMMSGIERFDRVQTLEDCLLIISGLMSISAIVVLYRHEQDAFSATMKHRVDEHEYDAASPTFGLVDTLSLTFLA